MNSTFASAFWAVTFCTEPFRPIDINAILGLLSQVSRHDRASGRPVCPSARQQGCKPELCAGVGGCSVTAWIQVGFSRQTQPRPESDAHPPWLTLHFLCPV